MDNQRDASKLLHIHDVTRLKARDYEVLIEYEGEFALVTMTAEDAEYETEVWGDEAGESYVCGVPVTVKACMYMDEDGEAVMPCRLDEEHLQDLEDEMRDDLVSREKAEIYEKNASYAVLAYQDARS